MIELCVLAGVVVALAAYAGPAPVIVGCLATALAASSRTAWLATPLAAGLAAVYSFVSGVIVALMFAKGFPLPPGRIALPLLAFAAALWPGPDDRPPRWAATLALTVFATVSINGDLTELPLSADLSGWQTGELCIALAIAACVGVRPGDLTAPQPAATP